MNGTTDIESMAPVSQTAIGFWTWIWAAVLTLLVAPPFFDWTSLAIQFSKLFLGFGADLPEFTKAVLSSTPTIAWLLRIAITVQLALLLVFIAFRSAPARRAFFTCALINFAIELILAGALYAPTFEISARF